MTGEKAPPCFYRSSHVARIKLNRNKTLPQQLIAEKTESAKALAEHCWDHRSRDRPDMASARFELAQSRDDEHVQN